MTTSAAQAAAFYREAVRESSVWAIRDSGGFPAPKTADGYRAMPFWSLRSRAERVIATVPAYEGFAPVEISLDMFRSAWLPDLRRDGLHVGVNWSGARATGYDLSPDDVELNLTAAAQRAAASG